MRGALAELGIDKEQGLAMNLLLSFYLSSCVFHGGFLTDLVEPQLSWSE